MKKNRTNPGKVADSSTGSPQASSPVPSALLQAGRGLRCQAEAKLSERKKKAVPFPTTEADIWRLVHELEVHQIELQIQNEELVGAKAEMEALLRQYTDLYDFAPAGYFTLARDGMIRRANLAGAKLLSVERGKLVNRRFGLFVSAKTRSAFDAFLGKVFESEKKETCEVALQKDGADPIWVNIEAIKEDERECRVLVEDITGRKQAEEKADEARVFAESIIATVRQPLLVLNADLHVITANRSFYEVFKVKQEETEGKLLYELGNHQWNISKLRELLENILPKNTKLNDFEVEHNFENIGQKTMLVNARRVYRETNRTHMILLAIEDITERKQIEGELEKHQKHLGELVEERTAELQKSEAKFRAIFDNASDGMFLFDLKTRKFFMCNSECENLLGYAQEEFLNLDIVDIHPEEDLPFISEQIGKYSRSGKSIRNDIKFKRKDGSIFSSDVSPALISIAGKKYILIIFKNITERKQAEEAIIKERALLRTLIDNLPSGIFVKDKEYRKIIVNPVHVKEVTGHLKYLGINTEFDILGRTDFEIFPKKQAKIFFTDDQKVVRDGSIISNKEGRGYSDDGTPSWMLISKIPLRDENGEITGMIGITTDITERKQAEDALRESGKNYRELINGMNETVWVIDFNGNLIDVNNTAVKVLGYSKKELLAIGLYGIDSSLKKENIKALAKAMSSDKLQIFETSHTTKEGRTFPVEVYSSLVIYQGNQAILSIARDITDRKLAEEQIQKDLQEKEILLRELYHRTKNNMQVICAILRLQASRLKDQKMKELLKKIETKIYSMALVHQKLISSKDLSHLNLKDYIDSLIIHFKQSYIKSTKNISIHADITDINVLLDTAIPLGLVLDELFSNAVTHAFPKKTRGKIKVNLYLSPKDGLVLEVSDNGIGFPKGFDIKKDIHLGLEMAIDLVEHQLSGKIFFKNEKGLLCRIVLKKEIYEQRV